MADAPTKPQQPLELQAKRPRGRPKGSTKEVIAQKKAEIAQTIVEPIKKRAGRPKGSKNKPFNPRIKPKPKVHWTKQPGTRGNIAARKYDNTYCDLAYNLAQLGLTNEKIANYLNVHNTTISEWQNKYPEFKKALEKGRLPASGEVANALYRSAVGYSHPDEVMQIDTRSGRVFRADTVKHYPPNVYAAIKWLERHHPDMWQNKSTLEITGAEGGPLAVAIRITAEELPKPKQPKPAEVVDTTFEKDATKQEQPVPIIEPKPEEKLSTTKAAKEEQAAQGVVVNVEEAEMPKVKVHPADVLPTNFSRLDMLLAAAKEIHKK